MSRDKPYRPPVNQRLAPELYTRASYVYFITIRAYKKQCPFALPGLSELAVDVLREEQERQDCAVFTYCLMPDHLHFLVSPKTDGVSILIFANQYKGKSTNRAWSAGWRGKLWQPRYYDHIVRAEEDLYAIDQYILYNPVRKKLVECFEDWPWSGHLNPLARS